jgi:hypothetical protein
MFLQHSFSTCYWQQDMSIEIKDYLFNSGTALVLHGERCLTDNELKKLNNLSDEDRGKVRVAVLSRTSLSDDGLCALAALPSLKEIYLGGTRLTEDAPVALCATPSLEVINLDDTLVGDAAVDQLKRARKLRILSLRNTCLTDRGLQTITELRTLQECYLEGTQVTELGKRRLANAMYQVTPAVCYRWVMSSMRTGTRPLVRRIIPA